MVQILLLIVAGVIGALVTQLPAFALRDPLAYATQMAAIRAKYEPLEILGLDLGRGMVGVFERLGFFRVFNAPWFVGLLVMLVLSIVVCTLDRTPKLWRSVRRVTVEQPAAFFDLRLPERALFHGGVPTREGVAKVLRGRRFKVRSASRSDVRVDWVYGDRNQYFKMATLLTHTGLVLFLLGGATTAALGFETVVFVGNGQTAPVQPIGTPDNMLVQNIRFEAPQRQNGSFEDFRTDLAVYQDGVQIARKTIRVNDPLEVNGFVFHQNTFGPGADLEIRDGTGRLLWTGDVILPGAINGAPQGSINIPGSPIVMLVVLDRGTSGVPLLTLAGLTPATTAGSSDLAFAAKLGVGATTDPIYTAGYSITWVRPSVWTGMVIKKDPGAPIIWVAFLCLMAGLVLSFYFPRRRVWARFSDERLQLAMVADRYVDASREFTLLVEELARQGGQRREQRP